MCKNHFSPVQCIIPPYINDKLVKSGSGATSAVAVNNKFRSHRFRSDREFFRNISRSEKRVLNAFVQVPEPVAAPVMEVYDCNNSTSLGNATIIWSNASDEVPTDQDARNVITGGRETWNFYNELFGRNSIDNQGMIIQQFIHYDRMYGNAFWDGRRMVYGDGDGQIFGSFTADIDIIAHELTHGVTQYEANLDYSKQSGALNESFSDVFAILIKQKALNQDVKQSDWLIGQNVLLGDEYALRSLKAPGTAYRNHPEIGDDPQPATMDEFMNLPDTSYGDWGGVHYNSGIANYAFYVAAYNMGGFVWEKAGRIWYGALTDTVNLKTDATFSDMRKVTIDVATQLYGENSLEVQAVTDGWNAAKVI